jgi:hypothetical protein
MLTPREQDEFDRMQLTAEIERKRGLIASYDENQELYRREVGDHLYSIGRIDERLAGVDK